MILPGEDSPVIYGELSPGEFFAPASLVERIGVDTLHKMFGYSHGATGPIGPTGVTGAVGLTRAPYGATMESEEQKRFRSFAERYVVERAASFRAGHEQEDAWACVQEAVNVYTTIHEVAERRFPFPQAERPTQALPSSAPNKPLPPTPVSTLNRPLPTFGQRGSATMTPVQENLPAVSAPRPNESKKEFMSRIAEIYRNAMTDGDKGVAASSLQMLKKLNSNNT